MSDITDVPLYQIIGAPLLALVQGETQAAQATARFIEQVGFEEDEVTEGGALRYGRLKVVTFRYSKTGVGGNVTNLEVEIPVLSIIPIPALQIREAEIDFAVEINSIVELDSPTAINTDRLPGTKQDSSLDPKLVAFKAGLARQDSKSAMKINIKVGQADTPVGLLTLFRVLDQGITSREVPTTTDTTPTNPAPPAG